MSLYELTVSIVAATNVSKVVLFNLLSLLQCSESVRQEGISNQQKVSMPLQEICGTVCRMRVNPSRGRKALPRPPSRGRVFPLSDIQLTPATKGDLQNF